uniref:mRNA m(6)A methyltransferase n=1 Tax=Romanomermis culicivorax TaxID=13658 RepID=A0A915I212_ROMCU
MSKNSSNLTKNSSNNTVVDRLDDLESLLAQPSSKEKEKNKITQEIMDLLNKKSAKEQCLAEKFKSDGTHVKEFCPHGTKDNCRNFAKSLGIGRSSHSCTKLHFRKIIQKHTDESLGDCSFLNTCFHLNTCKYIHYEIDFGPLSTDRNVVKKDPSSTAGDKQRKNSASSSADTLPLANVGSGINDSVTTLFPPQWIQCDLRFFDLTVLGKFSVVMADPPWDIHMELPYGTMSDDEMRHLNVQCLQNEGLMFLWVTGRAMELGRECLKLWGYTQCDEIIWVKTNQLQRIIRTGRTGHWLNHGKEHCLVGVKGSIDKYNRWLDCDVIVAEVRATSHKPDEVYGLIERLSPGTRKIELFGRQHNVQPNWITLGNQLDGVRLLDSSVVGPFKKRYPDGNCMPKPDDIMAVKYRFWNAIITCSGNTATVQNLISNYELTLSFDVLRPHFCIQQCKSSHLFYYFLLLDRQNIEELPVIVKIPWKKHCDDEIKFLTLKNLRNMKYPLEWENLGGKVILSRINVDAFDIDDIEFEKIMEEKNGQVDRPPCFIDCTDNSLFIVEELRLFEISGNEGSEFKSQPIPFARASIARIVDFACGKNHCVLLDSDGLVYTMGSSSRGQLGRHCRDACVVETTLKIVEHLVGLRIKCIAVGGWHTLALT